MGRYLLALLCMILLLAWWVSNRSSHYVYNYDLTLSAQQVKQYENYCRSIEEKSGIAIILSLGKAPVKLSRPHMMEVHVQENNITLLFSEDLKNAFTPLQQLVLLDGAKLMISQGKKAEALEFVFLNFVEMVAHSEQVSMTNLLDSSSGLSQQNLLALLILSIILFSGAVYLFVRLGSKNSGQHIPISSSFGGPMGNRCASFGGSIDSDWGR